MGWYLGGGTEARAFEESESRVGLASPARVIRR